MGDQDTTATTPEKGSAVSWLAKAGLAGLLLIVATGAFLGMGLFMWNMGNDMRSMTTSVVQMGKDVTSMAQDVGKMAGRMEVMAKSMVDGQAGMSRDLAAMRVAWSPWAAT